MNRVHVDSVETRLLAQGVRFSVEPAGGGAARAWLGFTARFLAAEGPLLGAAIGAACRVCPTANKDTLRLRLIFGPGGERALEAPNGAGGGRLEITDLADFGTLAIGPVPLEWRRDGFGAGWCLQVWLPAACIGGFGAPWLRRAVLPPEVTDETVMACGPSAAAPRASPPGPEPRQAGTVRPNAPSPPTRSPSPSMAPSLAPPAGGMRGILE